MASITKKSKTSLKRSAKKPSLKNVEKPFEQSLLQRAKKLADDYSLIVRKDDRLGFIGSSIELPNVFAEGTTISQCYNATREALAVAIATMIECGRKPPNFSSARKRTVQVNIRLTQEEKLLLSNTSTDLGFRGISDFIRKCALERIHSI